MPTVVNNGRRTVSRSGSIATSVASRAPHQQHRHASSAAASNYNHHHHHQQHAHTSYDDAVLQWASQAVSIPSATRVVLLEDLVANRQLCRSITGVPCAAAADSSSSSHHPWAGGGLGSSQYQQKLDEELELQIGKIRAEGSVYREQFEKYCAWMRNPHDSNSSSSSSGSSGATQLTTLLLRECKLELCYLQNSESFFEWRAVSAELTRQQASLLEPPPSRTENNDPNDGTKKSTGQKDSHEPSHSSSASHCRFVVDAESTWHPSATDPRRFALMQTLRIVAPTSSSSSSSTATDTSSLWKRVDVVTFDADGLISLVVRTLLPPVSYCATQASASPPWSPPFGSFLPALTK